MSSFTESGIVGTSDFSAVESLEALERRIDSEQERARAKASGGSDRQASHPRQSSNPRQQNLVGGGMPSGPTTASPLAASRSSGPGSDGRSRRSAPITIASNPVRTTVGFGANSQTKTNPITSSPAADVVSPGVSSLTSSSIEKIHPDKGHSSGSKKSRSKSPQPAPTADAASAAAGPDREHKYPSKAKMSKKERRELQERQRAEKAARKAAGGGGSAGAAAAAAAAAAASSSSATAPAGTAASVTGPRRSSVKKPSRVAPTMQVDDEKVRKQKSKMLAKQKVPQHVQTQKQVGLFSHLRQYERSVSLTKDIDFSKNSPLHPAIVRLGLKMSDGRINGSTSRCVALLQAFKSIIQSYKTPPGKVLSRDLISALSPNISFLGQCRPLSVSMGNAIKHIKHEITHELKAETPEPEAKAYLCDSIDQFIKERIVLAQDMISQFARSKIQDGDVILVHSSSTLLLRVLNDAHKEGRKFRVTVVDSRPKMRGQSFVRKLIDLGIDCGYVQLNAISYVMREVNKVFLSAHALLANGYVMSDVGSSMVAMTAKAYHVPTLLCCETYKFCERVQTDSFVFNELGDPSDIVPLPGKSPVLSAWHDIPAIKLLNLVYDVTPPSLVDMVITDIGTIPCSSVPVVLRVKDAQKGSIEQ